MRRETGITIIALVITIIILIILAGISISNMIGENGIITKAKEAKRNMILAGEAEALQLNQLYYELETGGELTENEESAKKDEIIENLQKELADISEKTNATADKILKDYVAYSKGELIRGLMEDNGELNGSLNCGESYIIPTGYTSGGEIIANSLESQTQATATEGDITEGVTAWVNGTKITGNRKSSVISPWSVKVVPTASYSTTSTDSYYLFSIPDDVVVQIDVEMTVPANNGSGNYVKIYAKTNEETTKGYGTDMGNIISSASPGGKTYTGTMQLQGYDVIAVRIHCTHSGNVGHSATAKYTTKITATW